MPVAVTVNVVFVPAPIVRFCGCAVIDGAAGVAGLTVRMAVSDITLLPTPFVNTTRYLYPFIARGAAVTVSVAVATPW